MNEKRKGYPSDVSDEEWSFCAHYLTLMREQAPQREYSLRQVFNALRYLLRVGGAWRMPPNDLPPWNVVYQQTQRWIKAGCFEAMAHDLRAMLRTALDRKADPSAVILDSRTVQSTPESGARAGIRNARAPRCISPWTPWAICWPWQSRQPMNKTAPRSANWPKRCKRK